MACTRCKVPNDKVDLGGSCTLALTEPYILTLTRKVIPEVGLAVFA